MKSHKLNPASNTPLLDLLNKLKSDADSISRDSILGKMHWLLRYSLCLVVAGLFAIGMLFSGAGGGYAHYEGTGGNVKDESDPLK